MSTDFAVVVTQPMHLDYQCFLLWIYGYPVDDAIPRWQPPQKSSQLGIAARAHVEYVRNQYHTFSILESYLEYPTGDDGRVQTFTEQSLIRLPPHVQATMIDSYYALDDPVAREMIGKKLTTRLRKDLEDVAEENPSIHVQRCRRHFDNLKRVFREVEDVPGPLPQTIAQMFLLSPQLSIQYAHLVFCANYRIETQRKKLANLNYSDIDFCIGVIMDFWTGDGPGQPGPDLDPVFLRDISDIKSMVSGLSETLEEYRNFVCVAFELAGRAGVANRSHMNQMIRSALHIGAGLRHEKEFKDLLNDILEKIIEPSKKLGWMISDFELFFSAFTDRFRALRSTEALRAISARIYRIA